MQWLKHFINLHVYLCVCVCVFFFFFFFFFFVSVIMCLTYAVPFLCNNTNNKQEAHGPRFAHLNETDMEFLQMTCNIYPVLPQQLGHKFDRAVKNQSSSKHHHLNLESLMLYTKIQPQSFLSSAGEDF